MNKDDLKHYFALLSCHGIGPVSIQKLMEANSCKACEIALLPSSTLLSQGLTQAQIVALSKPPQSDIDSALAWLSSDSNHHILSIDCPAYPEILKEIKDAPLILYAIGRIELLHTPQIAIVGSRNCTPGGSSTAHQFAAYLAKYGCTITSGLALGIDQHAHQGALEASGNTIAVIGTGIDRIYPSKNKKLAYQIATLGLIISEFPLGTGPNGPNFPKRNRIISGLSVATLVIEAAKKSGSLITAYKSLEQGREVFAIPGSIHNPQAKGCHQLIRQGAKLVDQASDIIEELSSLLGYIAEHSENTSQTLAQNKINELDTDYQQLLDTIGYDPVSIDVMVERSGLTIEQLSSMLLILELNDQIQSAPGGLYIRC